MARKGKTFNVNVNFISRLGQKFARAQKNYDIEMERRVMLATKIIWQTAQSRRPMMNKVQMKEEGRKTRVSLVDTKAGVPVRTGALRGSIKYYVTRLKGMSFRGTIETKGIPYAGHVEYGTSRMPARSFMRSAIEETKDAVAKVLKAKVSFHTK